MSGIVLSIAFLVVLLNTNLVQTFLAHKASAFFSKAWNAEVHIKSLNIGFFSYVTIEGVRVVDPGGNLLCDAETIKCSFKGFPLNKGLNLQNVYVENTEFHLKLLEEGINLAFIIDYFKSDKPDDTTKSTFPIHVDKLELENITFSLQNKRSTEDTIIEVSPHKVDTRNMYYTNLYAVIKDISVINDSIQAQFETFKTDEKSGFVLKNMSMNAHVSSKGIQVQEAVIETPYSLLLFDASLQYTEWGSMGDFIDSVQIDAQLKKGSYGNIKDAGFWASSLSNADVFAYFNGDVNGTISNLNVNTFTATFGQFSTLKLKGYLKGLPYIKQSTALIDLELISGSLNDINSLRFPLQWNIPRIPSLFTNRGEIIIKANVEGTMNDCLAQLNVYTDIGDIEGSVGLIYDKKKQQYLYNAALKTNSFHLQPLFHTDWLQKASLDMLIKGEGFDFKNMNTSLEASVTDLKIKGYTYDEILIDADLINQNLRCNINTLDKNIGLNLAAVVDLQPENKGFDFQLDIKKANLKPLGIDVFNDTAFEFTSKIEGSVKGTDIDRMTGAVNIKESILELHNKHVSIGDIEILLKGDAPERSFSLTSDFIEILFNGDIKVNEFNCITNKLMYHFFPQYNPITYNPKADFITSEFDFNIFIKDFSKISPVFNDALFIASNSFLKGTYSEEDFLSLSLKSDTIRFQGFTVEELELNSMKLDSLYDITLSTPFIYLNDLILMRNTAINIQSNRSVFDVDLWWDDQTDTAFSSGKVHFRGNVSPKSIRFNFIDSKMFIHGTHWTINENHNILYNNGDFMIDNLSVSADNQKIKIEGEMSDDAENELTLYLENFNADIVNFFTKQHDIKLGGLITGKFTVNKAQNKTYFKIDSKIQDLLFNEEYLGMASIKSYWDNKNDRLKIQFVSQIDSLNKKLDLISANGYYYPSKEENNLDFQLKFDSFKLNTLSSFISSFVSEIGGTLSGLLDVKGSFKDPQIKGTLDFHSAQVLINLLNTKYYLNDKCYLSGNTVSFKHFKIEDTLKNNAFVDGEIVFNNFKNLIFNLNLTSDKFLFMNTYASSNDVYYGTVMASTNATLKGNTSDLRLTINAQAEKGTYIVIPINAKAKIEEQKYIRFVSKEDSISMKQKSTSKGSNSSLNIVINLKATPDAKISIPMDFNQISGNITASGEGSLRLGINSKDGFTISGNYLINTGGIKIKFLSFIEKEFTIENGGTILWTGNPIDANLNINAIHSLKASLSPLFPPSEADLYRRQIDVQSVMSIKGKLMDPKTSFDIKFPHADQSTEDIVANKIGRGDEMIMLQQTLSLLFLGQFYSANSTGGNEVSSGVNIFATQVSGLLSNMLGLNLGITYKENVIQARIHQEWDRFFIDVGGNVNTTTEQTQENNNSLIGDLLIGFRINNYWNINGFNRSNINDFTKVYLPFTQGVGIMYKKDFETIKDLFTRRKEEVKPKVERNKSKPLK